MKIFKDKIAILIILLTIIILAIYGYFNATSGIKREISNVPKIKALSNSFDFGEIKYGKIVEHKFTLKNIGTKNLKIKRIATSCSCTTATIEKKDIKPNEEVNVIVKYNTSLMGPLHSKGKQERIIYIQSNDPINPQIELKIRAYVKSD